jgi:SEC-C motif/Protein of unknown function (DUF1186)
VDENENILDKIAVIPIDDILDGIADSEGTPIAYIGLAQIRAADAAPRFLTLLSNAANGLFLEERDETLLFYGLHILGAARNQSAFGPLTRFLRLPDEELEIFLGDARAETLPQIVAGMFDGDAESLFAAAGDKALDPVTRHGLIGAIAFLTWDGRIETAAAKRFFERFDDERLGDDEESEDPLGWDAWENAIAMLGWRDFMPRVEAAFEDGRISSGMSEFEDFLHDLEDAEAAPASYERFTDVGLGYIDDIGAAFDWMGEADEDDVEYDDDLNTLPPIDDALSQPIINPLRDVGRNDPCPCGSGKKAKKCCLANG